MIASKARDHATRAPGGFSRGFLLPQIRAPACEIGSKARELCVWRIGLIASKARAAAKSRNMANGSL